MREQGTRAPGRAATGERHEGTHPALPIAYSMTKRPSLSEKRGDGGESLLGFMF